MSSAILSIDGCEYAITQKSCPQLFYHVKHYHESAQAKKFEVRVHTEKKSKKIVVNPSTPLIPQIDPHLPPLEFGYKFYYDGHRVSDTDTPLQMSMGTGDGVDACTIINSEGQ